MENYLKEFNTHSEYETFKASTDFIRPNVSICNLEDDVHYNGHDYSKDYLTFKALEDSTFNFSTNDILYSTDYGTTWTTLTAGTNTPTVSTDSKIMWKASGLTPTSFVGIGTFSSTGKFDVEGNVMSLVGGDSFSETVTISNYQLRSLFENCTNLVNTKHLILPTATLATYCYNSMFKGCTSLITAPELPAITLASNCYWYMFSGCTKLTTAPILPATTLAVGCYMSMFSDCTSLMTVPSTLPATVLTNNCYYNMFQNCTSLTTAPELPAITLANNCYLLMFRGCTSLTTAPELPATTLVSGCYSNIFQGCSNLNYIKAMFTTAPGGSYTNSWVDNVASSGTFVKNSAATWNVTGIDGIPTGWTIQTASD